MFEETKLLFDVNKAPILHRTFPGVRSPSNEKRAEFVKNYGIKIKTGIFSVEESDRIIKNFEEFLNFYDIKDNFTTRCALLGFKLEDPGEEEIIALLKQLIKPCGFYFHLAYKLPNRLISAVYERARKILNPFRRQSDIDKKTREEMIEYAKSSGEYKHIYAHMANKFNCEPIAVRKIVQRKTDLNNSITFNTGKFSKMESIRLLDSICNYLKIDPLSLSSQLIRKSEISWTQVAKDVRTRHPDPCRHHATGRPLLRNLSYLKREVIKWRIKKEKKSTNSHLNGTS